MFLCLLLAISSLSAITDEKGLLESFKALSQQPGAASFHPPSGWHLADSKALPEAVKIMIVGKSSSDYPPSLNLVVDPYKGNLKSYLKIVKAYNDSQGADWKDLGTLRLDSGETASLSQVDTLTKWGVERQMHVILVKDGNAYILTAAALKDEFPKFYKEFFNSLKSLKVNSN